MTLREKLERANPTVDSPTYRRLTNQINDNEYRRALETETRQIQDRQKPQQGAQGR